MGHVHNYGLNWRALAQIIEAYQLRIAERLCRKAACLSPTAGFSTH
jgi:hypothetical protein